MRNVEIWSSLKTDGMAMAEGLVANVVLKMKLKGDVDEEITNLCTYCTLHGDY